MHSRLEELPVSNNNRDLFRVLWGPGVLVSTGFAGPDDACRNTIFTPLFLLEVIYDILLSNKKINKMKIRSVTLSQLAVWKR